MYRHHHWLDDTAEREVAERQTSSLAAIVVVLLLLIGSLYLVHQLRSASLFQDCLLSGRRNCTMFVIRGH